MDYFRWAAAGFVLLALIWAPAAFGQASFNCNCTGDDCTIPCQDTGGVAGDTDQLCLERVDAGAPGQLACMSVNPGDVATFQVTITRTPDQDAEIRCFADDEVDNVSEASPNACFRDFTAPPAPVLVP